MGNSKDRIWDRIKVEWNAGGFVSLATAGVYSGLTLLADNSENAFVGGAILATAIGIKALMSGISIKKKGKSVEKLYIDSFNLVVAQAIETCFSGQENEVMNSISNITMDKIDIYKNDLNDIKKVVFQILQKDSVNTDIKTVSAFMEEIVANMIQKIREDEKLRGYVSHLYIEAIYKCQQQQTQLLMDNTKLIEEKADELDKKIQRLLEYSENNHGVQNTAKDEQPHIQAYDFETIRKNIKNEKDKYIEKWHAKLFLESIKQKSVKDGSTPKEDKTLENTYINHGYKDVNPYSSMQSDRIENFEEKIENIINNAYKQDKILITGEPGVGKSSLVACLADKFANDDRVFFIDFRKLNKYFEKDLPDDKRKILSAVADLFKPKANVEEMQAYIKEVLKEQKVTLIFDGFDEFIADGEAELLISLLTDDLLYKNISVIITSRINYIKHLNEKHDFVRLFNKWYNLEGFSDKNIEDYYENIIGEEMPKDKKIPQKNKDVLGIPVILYMSLSLGIDIFADADRYEMYSKIFALRGGIFDRFADIVDDNQGYDKERREMAIKEPLYYLMQMLAFALFENDEGHVAKADYLKLAEHIRNEKAEERKLDAAYTANALDYPVKNILEGEGRVEFVHKTIYEYFIALKIFNEIKALYDVNHIIKYEPENKEFNDFINGFAKRFGGLFKIGRLIRGEETAVYDFLKAMLKEAFKQGRSRNSFFYQNLSDMSLLSAGFGKMFEKGLSYYTIDYSKTDLFVKNTKRYSAAKDVNALMKTVNEQEQTCFKNMIDLIQLIRQVTGKENDLFESKGDKDKHDYRRYICRYLKMGHYDNLNLSDFDLSDFRSKAGVNLNIFGFHLSTFNSEAGDDLSGIDMSGYILRHVKLNNSSLVGTILYKADLSTNEIKNADFTNCNLEFADLSGATITNCDFTGAQLGGCIADINEIRNPVNHNIITDTTSFTGAGRAHIIGSPDEIYIGGTFEFGSYPQGANGEEMPIMWRVLDIVDGYALLLSDKILDAKTYHEKNIVISWDKCTLNDWLNTDFCNEAFKTTFADKIIKLFSRKKGYTNIHLAGNIAADLIIKPQDIISANDRMIAGKNDNCNRVFLLSDEELYMYFDRIRGRKNILENSLGGEQAAAYGTEYAIKRGLSVYGNDRSHWWLRSFGSAPDLAMYVLDDGDVVDALGTYVFLEDVGVRPALWINLKS